MHFSMMQTLQFCWNVFFTLNSWELRLLCLQPLAVNLKQVHLKLVLVHSMQSCWNARLVEVVYGSLFLSSLLCTIRTGSLVSSKTCWAYDAGVRVSIYVFALPILCSVLVMCHLLLVSGVKSFDGLSFSDLQILSHPGICMAYVR